MSLPRVGVHPDVPDWPDFVVERVDFGGQVTWRGTTNTGRPKTPMFTVVVSGEIVRTLDDAKLWLRIQLDDAFARAHPNGCPGSH